MGAVKSHYWDEINRVRCVECDGDGEIEKPEPLEVQYGGPFEVEIIECPHCCGDGECDCIECVNTRDAEHGEYLHDQWKDSQLEESRR